MRDIRANSKFLFEACVAPHCEALGMILSRIHVVNSTGEPPMALGAMDHKQEITQISQVKRMK